MKPIHLRDHMKIIGLVLKTNLTLLLAKKSLWASLFLFSLVLLIIFPFALGIEVLKKFEVQIGSYWIIQEFLVSLLVLNMFKFETENNMIDIYQATRSSRLAFFFGKVIFTFLQILSLQVPLILFWIIVFNPDIAILLKVWPTLLCASGLFALNSSLLGGFLFSITHKTQLKEILQPLLFFPLQSATLLASVGACLASQSAHSMLEWSTWWNILLIYPVLFIGLSLIFGELLLEE